MSINTAQSLKKEGSQLLLEKKYEAAIDKYTEALDLEPTGTLLWEIISNRSLAYTSSRDYTNGLMDANKLIDIAPRFKRSYLRLAQALLGRQEFNDALKACDDGLTIDSTNQELVLLRLKIESRITTQRRKAEEGAQAQVVPPVVPPVVDNKPQNSVKNGILSQISNI